MASGPTCLASANWTCPNYRRSVAAGLVQGAYDLEKARKKPRGYEPTWEKFHFALEDKLVDDDDSSIFGAIYKFNPPKSNSSSSGDAPKFVVAFRGTKNLNDIKLDFHIFINDLAGKPRFGSAMKAVEKMASAVESRSLWLAGHSLGASIAMLAGKEMAMRGINIETFLFNPPYLSGWVEWIPCATVRRILRTSKCVLSVGAAFAMEGYRESSRDYFAKLSSWVPHLFVNSDDRICSGYIGYFENREYMKKIGAGGIGRVATRTSLRVAAVGGQSQPLHLLPSANLTKNSFSRNLTALMDIFDVLKEAHSIDQWSSRDLNLQSQEYRYSFE